MNMLRIISSHWSHYLLEYSKICELDGCIELDTKIASYLGLQNISPLQLKLISTLITCMTNKSYINMFTNSNHSKKHSTEIHS